MFAGINMFCALLRLILAQAARRKHYYYYYHFGGHWGNKHWKNDNKTVWRIFFFTSAARKRQQTLKWLTIIWFSLFIGLFQRAKMHFSPPNSPFWPVKCTTMPDKVMIIIVFTSMPSSCLQGRQYPTASLAIQPGVSSFDSNAEQRLQMALLHFMHEYFVASKQE